jgi:hypothetical protein
MQLCIASIPDRLNKELTTIISKKVPASDILVLTERGKKSLAAQDTDAHETSSKERIQWL